MNENGNSIFEAEIESMNEIAGWIFTQGKNLLTIEPQKLASEIFDKLQYMNQLFTKEKDILYRMDVESDSNYSKVTVCKSSDYALREPNDNYHLRKEHAPRKPVKSFSQAEIDDTVIEVFSKVNKNKPKKSISKSCSERIIKIKFG